MISPKRDLILMPKAKLDTLNLQWQTSRFIGLGGESYDNVRIAPAVTCPEPTISIVIVGH